MKEKHETTATAITGLEFDQTATRHVLEDVERKVEDNRKATEDLTSELDVRFNVAVSDVENMIAEPEDRVVEKLAAKLAERDQQQLFAVKVRQAAAELNDSGMASTPTKSFAASTPTKSFAASTFQYPVSSKHGEDSKDLLKELNVQLKQEVEAQEAKIRWLEEMLDGARDIRRREDIVE